MAQLRRLPIVIATVFMLAACSSQRMPAPVVETSEPEPAELVEESANAELGYVSHGVQTQPLEEAELNAVDLAEATPLATSIEPAEEIIVPPNPAVIALLNSAETQTQAGDHARAAATLERAVQIDPKNAGIWHRLAKTRFKQALYQEAANLATRSNSLAGNDRDLRADNWLLISRARRALGDEQGATEAEKRAEQFLKVSS